MLKAWDVTVYAVGYRQHQGSGASMQPRVDLERFAKLTGGLAFFPSEAKDVENAFVRTAARLPTRLSRSG
jgi:hypothetical protein